VRETRVCVRFEVGSDALYVSAIGFELFSNLILKIYIYKATNVGLFGEKWEKALAFLLGRARADISTTRVMGINNQEIVRMQA
jgi:hypothetical protein